MNNQNGGFIPTFNNLAFASNAFKILDSLCNERKSWEDNEFRTSTTRLYALLAKVYSVYEATFVSASDEDRRVLRRQMMDKLREVDVITRKSTDTLGLLIRYVFAADRRRVMSYKAAIVAARSHDIKPEHMADWLTEQGGVHEVARKISFSAEAQKRREARDNAVNLIQEEIANRVSEPLLKVKLPTKNIKNRVVLLAEPADRDEFKVLYLFDDPPAAFEKALVRRAAATKAQHQVEIKQNRTEVTVYFNGSKEHAMQALATV